jgi:[ribosomal protein S18]-alanine N-acetyltransferase
MTVKQRKRSEARGAMLAGGGQDVFIRPMEPRDLDEVHRMEAACYPRPWTKAMFLEEFRREGLSRLWAAEEVTQGRILGYVCFWLLAEEIHLLNLAVHPDCRRRGIGRRLLAEVLRLGREQGVDRVDLEVRPSNVAARRLYDLLGFETAGRRAAYYPDSQEDALIMVLQGMSNPVFGKEVLYGE